MIRWFLRWLCKPPNKNPYVDYEWEIRHYIENGTKWYAGESIEANMDREEKQRNELVEQDPQRCLGILVALMTSPSFQSPLDHSGEYWRESIEYGIAELLEVCVDLNRENFIEAIAPLLSNPRVRSVLLNLDDAKLMEQLEEYNRANQS